MVNRDGQVPASEGLLRRLSRLDIAGMTLNNVIGAGIFALPATLAAAAGDLSLAVLVVAFALMALIAVCTVEVASRYDVTGGPQHYAGDAFGPATGFAIGWLMVLSRLSSFSAIAVILFDYLAGLWPVLAEPTVRAAALALLIGALAAFNLRGVAHGAVVSNLLTVAKLLPLLVLAVAALALGGWSAGPSGASPVEADLGTALLLAFFACMGFEQAAVVAGEARNPQRDLPVGILAALAVVGVMYVLLLLACFVTVPDLATSRQPLADAARTLFGPGGGTAMSITAAISCAGGLSVSMMVGPRMLYALAAQGDLPAALGRVGAVRRTPGSAILVIALVAWLLTVSGTFVYLATFSVIARMLSYASTCLALITLRRRDGPAPVSIPLGPAWAVLAVACCAAVLATTTQVALRDVAIALAAGWLVRRFSSRPAAGSPGNG